MHGQSCTGCFPLVTALEVDFIPAESAMPWDVQKAMGAQSQNATYSSLVSRTIIGYKVLNSLSPDTDML